MITTAQRKAASMLPFALSDAEITRQFSMTGMSIPREARDPMTVARNLARNAMNDQVLTLAKSA